MNAEVINILRFYISPFVVAFFLNLLIRAYVGAFQKKQLILCWLLLGAMLFIFVSLVKIVYPVIV